MMKNETLQLRPRRGTAEAERRDGRVILAGELEWLLQGSTEEIDAISKALVGVSESLGPELLLLDFGNAVGLFEVPVLGLLEVTCRKWERRHFEQMLVEVMAVASALPFAASNSAALPYDRSVVARDDVLYHAFVYLRHVLLDVMPQERALVFALDLILRDPHRRLDRVHRDVPLDKVHGLDVNAVVRMVAAGGNLIPVGDDVRDRLPIARLLKGYAPERIGVPHTDVTYDTPENRFVKTFLSGASGIIRGMRRVVRVREKETAFARRVVCDCDAMETVLHPIIRHRFWQQIGPMTHLPISSTVLQRRRGYRDVLHHFVKLRLATRVPLTKELVGDLLEGKDIAQLYELWCYFSLVQHLERLLGAPVSATRPRSDDVELTLPRNLEVAWPDGTRVVYNPRFSRASPSQRYSYSVPLRPDIALEVTAGPNAGLHLFDAKFKLERLEALLADETEEELADEAESERRGTFKRGDLYKMHAYRDAIPQARSVWVLYPGTERRFFSAHGRHAPVTLPADGVLMGVGAIPHKPGEKSSAALQELLGQLIGSPA